MNGTLETTAGNHATGTPLPVAERLGAAGSYQAAPSGRRAWMLATLASAAGLLASGPNAARASSVQPRPFQSLVSGSIQPLTAMTFQLSGSGVVSQLGSSRHGGPVTITSVNPETGVIADTLTETFSAANGDSLTLLCQQIATPVSPGVYQAVDQWVAVGGTGRFAGVSGSGGGSTFVDLNALTYVKQCTGSITY